MKDIFRWPVLWWLRFWAKLALKKNRPFIVGVTGSAGKSSAVDAIAPVLKLKFKNLKIAEKANSESGIPADILGLHFTDYSFFDWFRICISAPLSFFLYPSSFDCYLVEMGVDEPTPPKNMGYLLTIIKPDMAVILNALPVHAEQFGKQLNLKNQNDIVKAIAREKGEIITANPNLRFAIINADDENLFSLKPISKARIVTFGKSPTADVKISSVVPSLSQTKVTLVFKNREYQILLKHLALPEFYGYTISAAFATGICLDQDPKMIAEKISSGFKMSPGRGQIFSGIKQTTIIDSSYNASGETMAGSLKMLQQIGDNKTKIAVLGDMRELGSQAKIEHEKVAEIAVKIADKIILIGPLMKEYSLPIVKRSKLPVEWFATAGEAANYLLEGSHPSNNHNQDAILQGNEIILVKGSQNTIFLEIVVEALLKNKSDVVNLCRRGKFWDKKRRPYQ